MGLGLSDRVVNRLVAGWADIQTVTASAGLLFISSASTLVSSTIIRRMPAARGSHRNR
jgi:hypothetical protein